MEDQQAKRLGHRRRGVLEVSERRGGQKAQGGFASQIPAGRQGPGAARLSPPATSVGRRHPAAAGIVEDRRNHDAEAARNSAITLQVLRRIGMGRNESRRGREGS